MNSRIRELRTQACEKVNELREWDGIDNVDAAQMLYNIDQIDSLETLEKLVQDLTDNCQKAMFKKISK